MKKQALVVVDMQNDFIDGALGSTEAQAIVPQVVEKAAGFDGDLYFTRDTHDSTYLSSQEGQRLPVSHCVRGTPGWEICDALQPFTKQAMLFDKPVFGSPELALELAKRNYDSIILVGLCTDICVISNAFLLKAYLPEAQIIVDAACCAGVTPESHHTALQAMKNCQIDVIE